MPAARSDAYDVVVIGAGLAGMTAGALLAQQGMRVLVADHRPYPGGVCHSFQREGFTFDVGPHLLSGCGDGWVVDQLLRRIGGREKVEFLPVDPLARGVSPITPLTSPPTEKGFWTYSPSTSPESVASSVCCTGRCWPCTGRWMSCRTPSASGST